MKDDILIAIVDDETLIVSLLSAFFDKNEGTKVVFQAESGEQLIDYLKDSINVMPHILLLDINMRGLSGIETMPIIKELSPDIHVIVMSSHYKKNFTGFMLKTGVAAFLPKGISPFKLKEIVEEVSEKGFYFLPEQLAVVRNQISGRSPKIVLDVHNTLTERELEVLKLICRQNTAKEIGETLCITQRTVEGHKKNLFSKTNTKNTAGLVIFAVQNNIIDLDNFIID